jgi:hypothetical protein
MHGIRQMRDRSANVRFRPIADISERVGFDPLRKSHGQLEQRDECVGFSTRIVVAYLARAKGETQLSVYFAKVSSVWVM